MRYVILFAGLAFFLIWDGIYNHGEYLALFVRAVRHGFQMIGVM